MLPSLLSSGKGIQNKNIFFEVKTKYPDLFKKKFCPLSNIFINNLLKDNKNFSGCFSKDRIIKLDNNKCLIYNFQNSNQKGSHWCSITGKNNKIFIFDSFGIGEIPSEIYEIYKNFKIITNIYQIQHITSILCGLYSILFILYDVKKMILCIFLDYLTNQIF